MNTPIDNLKVKICGVISHCIKNLYKLDVPINSLFSCCENPKSYQGQIAMHFFRFNKQFNCTPNQTSQSLYHELEKFSKAKDSEFNDFVSKFELNGPYINFYLKFQYFGRTIIDTVSFKNNYFGPLSKKADRIMIEYSQPNTHKAFHVGHMRNAALGDSLIRLYKQQGFEVVAANYFGDEGAHVAKCLWLLEKAFVEKDLDVVANDERGEFLGAFYTMAVELLDLSHYTCLPIYSAITAKITSVRDHPYHPTWKTVLLSISEEPESPPQQVVCNGSGFQEGDVVAYMPVGGRLKGKTLHCKDMKGILSHGAILASSEIAGAEENFASPAVFGKKASSSSISSPENSASKIFVFPEELPGAKIAVGQSVAEVGKVSGRVLEAVEQIKAAAAEGDCGAYKKVGRKGLCERFSVFDKINFDRFQGVNYDLNEDAYFYKTPTEIQKISKYTDYFIEFEFPVNETVLDFHSRATKEVSRVLKALEQNKEPENKLWRRTRQWSIDEFKRIYKWLDVHFDRDFFESEVSAGAQEIVIEYLEKGVFKRDEGCVGADLKEFGLGFCILQKTDGSFLYATKDLKLAKVKFDDYKIDKSIYVVDVSQSHHFKQVFATLKLMGYEKVENCFHLVYALVTTPEGKMSSRKGTVIVFSDLVKLLEKNLREKCFSEEKIAKNREYWTETRINDAIHTISVATIKYGMLNTDVGRELVFNLEEWANPNGNTGSYLMYQFTRVVSILREVTSEELLGGESCAFAKGCLPEHFDLLSHKMDQHLLFQTLRFRDVVAAAVSKNSPNLLCSYLYDLCKVLKNLRINF